MSFTLAHLSDLHVTPVRFGCLPWRLNKQTIGWLKWRAQRRHEYRPEILEALIADLHGQRPDHTVVTGDLTNLGLETELRAALGWLERLGDPRQVTLIPGNHDAYTPASAASLQAHWRAYLGSDTSEADLLFPSLRRRGPVALLGVSSVGPTGLLSAAGRVEPDQQARLGRLLQSLGQVCRVVLMHHPPTRAGLPQRRRLHDAQALQRVLAESGAELVLHGHTHTTTLTRIPVPHRAAIPVVGVRSASALGHKPRRSAQYHLYSLSPGQPDGVQISLRIRAYDPTSGGFHQLGPYRLTPLEKNSLPTDVFSVISA
ncbi:MAG: metallophosphoesterase [Desulfurellaceae bacterium]|nr:metallophosphoesterase [Desulfurellaceae bacterium]